MTYDADVFSETLNNLQLSKKHRRAIEIAGELVMRSGLLLIVDGVPSRLVAKAWGRKEKSGCSVIDCTIGMTSSDSLKDPVVDTSDTVVLLDANLSPLDVYARPIIDEVQRSLLGMEEDTPRKFIVTLTDSVAGLPVPNDVESISVRLHLDKQLKIGFDSEEVSEWLEDLELEEGDTWISKLWGPARTALKTELLELPSDEAVLVLSVLDGDNIEASLENSLYE